MSQEQLNEDVKILVQEYVDDEIEISEIKKQTTNGGHEEKSVAPELHLKDVVRTVLDITQSPEFVPPESRNLFFNDSLRRIDYILVWNDEYKGQEVNPGDEKYRENAEKRAVFLRNLENEGLQIEEMNEIGQELQYVKIHAPWEVLTRYGEIMKMRMPMKEVPKEIERSNIWEAMADCFTHCQKPFSVNREKVPAIPKKFTCEYSRDREYLFAIPEQKELFFSHAQRTRIVDYILRRKRFSDDEKDPFSFGINKLLSDNVYEAVYPLHEGSWKPKSKDSIRQLLYLHWAKWSNCLKTQPIDYIRCYFGEKIGLYFAWLGFYTMMLIPASVAGMIVFIYGVATMPLDIIAKETCDKNATIWMCPLCNMRCPYWPLSLGCRHTEASRMFDNSATVIFAVFMSLWGTVFLELWKREQAAIQFKWNLTNFEDEEEPPRPEYLAKLANEGSSKVNKVTGASYMFKLVEPYLPFKKRLPRFVLSISFMLFMVLVAVAVVFGVIAYRMAVLAALYGSSQPLVYRNASMVTTATSATINLIVIFILNFVYSLAAEKLTDMEMLRTQSEYDNSLNLKLYVLQFVNYYTSIFYIAFFKGRLVGRPGAYNTLFGARQEECQPGGCLIELSIQLAIIMIGKQIANQVMEIIMPPVMKAFRKYLLRRSTPVVKTKGLRPWQKDYVLAELGPRGLYSEYLEMMLQFGFVTIFVAAFPLAPLAALINNIFEIRTDANKFVTQRRRPIADRSATIGVWYSILYAVSRISVVTNALIISFSSNFIRRLVYEGSYSPDGSLKGYVNNSLSYFNVSDYSSSERPVDENNQFQNITICRYRDYRTPPWAEEKYKFTAQYWHILAAEFAFVVVFENVVFLITSFIAWLIPDMPTRLIAQVRREAYLANEIILKTELHRSKGESDHLSDRELAWIRKMTRATSMPDNLDGLLPPDKLDAVPSLYPNVDMLQPRLRRIPDSDEESKL